ncbi:MAG: hypothetical protein HYY26_05115 [Acidobacteria bacterium]|nr:hypothetical protein [Acidobacteriota bacterium]
MTLLLAPAAARAGSPDNLSPQNRLAIVRALASEYATARQPMPASKNVREALQVSHDGQVNSEKLRQDLAKRGAAVYSGEIIQITGIDFKPRFILLEINGGGRKGRKWWQRIQIEGGVGGMGGPTIERTPTGQPPPPPGPEPERTQNGSWVLLSFPDGIPDLTAEQVKQLLASVLDFTTRTAAVPWIETIPEEFRDAIKEKRVVVGMNREMVLAAKGRPERKVRETRQGQQYEDWLYGQSPYVLFVTFLGDQVVEVKDFH